MLECFFKECMTVHGFSFLSSKDKQLKISSSVFSFQKLYALDLPKNLLKQHFLIFFFFFFFIFVFYLPSFFLLFITKDICYFLSFLSFSSCLSQKFKKKHSKCGPDLYIFFIFLTFKHQNLHAFY